MQESAHAVASSSDTRKLLEGLNPEQVAVVRHHLGPLLTGAVAGAGKTASLVRRIAYLVLEHGVDPTRVLAVTFSAKAAKEMTIRLQSLVCDHACRVGTFHSLALEILKREDPRISTWEIDGEKNRYRTCVKEALGHRGMDWKGADLTVVTAFIGRCKARCALPDSPAAIEEAKAFYAKNPCTQRTATMLVEAYQRAETLRLEKRLITFDDMLLEAWRILKFEANARERWAARWDFVLQDECQDENLVQREIASMLSRDHRNYMVVGDPAQSIYAFRGSDPSGLLAFEGEWNAAKILMHRNYRSGDSIIRAANGVLGAMSEGTHLGMAITPCRGIEGDVRAEVYQTMDEEAVGVVESIRGAHEDGRPWRHNVVLYRTNAQSRALEEALLTERIPYVVIGGTNFWERKEVKDIVAYLRLGARLGSSDDVRRSINAPFRFLGKAFVEGLMDLVERERDSDEILVSDWTKAVRRYIARAQIQQRQKHTAEQWCSMMDALALTIAEGKSESKPALMLQRILDETQYIPWLTRDEGSESTENNRVSNVRELIRAAERFADVSDFLVYVEKQVELAKAAKLDVRGSDERVTLMSIHRSKGLEWPAVYVIGCNEGILPHGRCEDENEERRLAYVAITRARDALTLTCVRELMIGPRMAKVAPSKFISEAGIAIMAGGSSRAADPDEKVGMTREDVTRATHARKYAAADAGDSETSKEA
jgi:DNA helicase-2/ATP-dependent DNA helicase PcrA